MTSSKNSNWIIHVDMDAFYASVEILDNPDLQDQAVIVGGSSNRGVVCAASYAARRFGIHAAMPIVTARRLCPEGIFLPVRMGRYQEMSQQVFDCFYEITPHVEGLSVDEAFLDVSGGNLVHGDFEEIGWKIKRLIAERTGLVASVGLAPNKYLAKIASDLDKPDGFFRIRPDEIQKVLDPLPVKRVWGIGPRANEMLSAQGIKTIADLRRLDLERLKRLFKNRAQHFYELARGIDRRRVQKQAKDKSISNEQTFSSDLTSIEDMQVQLLYLSELVGWRLRQQGFKGRTISLKLRLSNLKRLSRQLSVESPTNSTKVIYDSIKQLLQSWYAKEYTPAVRLLGVEVTNFGAPAQLTLFGDGADKQESKIDKVLDEVKAKYGSKALKRAQLINIKERE